MSATAPELQAALPSRIASEQPIAPELGRASAAGLADARTALEGALSNVKMDLPAAKKNRAIGEITDIERSASEGMLREGQVITLKDADGNVTTVEARDGRIYVNGELTKGALSTTTLFEAARSHLSQKIVEKFAKGFGYETSFTVMNDGTVKWSNAAEIAFAADGSIQYKNCTDEIDPIIGANVAFRGHTGHKFDSAKGTGKIEEYSEDALAAIARHNIWGNDKPEMIVGRDEAGKVGVNILKYDSESGPTFGKYILTVPATEKLAEKTIALPISAQEIASMRAPMAAVAQGEFRAFTTDLASEQFGQNGHTSVAKIRGIGNKFMIDKASGDSLTIHANTATEELMSRMPESKRKELLLAMSPPQGKGMSNFELSQRMAQVLQQAGVFTGSIGVAVNARSGAYNAEAILNAIKDKVTSPEASPVRYCIVVGVGEKNKFDEALPDNLKKIVAVVESANENSIMSDVSRAMLSMGITENRYVSIGLTENEVGVVQAHYNALGSARNESAVKERANFMLIGKELAENIKGSESDALAAILLTQLVRLGTQDKTAVMAIGCSQKTITALSAFSAILRLITIAKLEISRIVTEFMTAMRATGRSL